MSDNSSLSAVMQPVETAQGLPNSHYIDPAVYEEERHALLFSQWAGLAVAADVPEIGDAKPIDFLGMPLLLVRDRDELSFAASEVSGDPSSRIGSACCA